MLNEMKKQPRMQMDTIKISMKIVFIGVYEIGK